MSCRGEIPVPNYLSVRMLFWFLDILWCNYTDTASQSSWSLGRDDDGLTLASRGLLIVGCSYEAHHLGLWSPRALVCPVWVPVTQEAIELSLNIDWDKGLLGNVPSPRSEVTSSLVSCDTLVQLYISHFLQDFDILITAASKEASLATDWVPYLDLLYVIVIFCHCTTV